MTSEPRARPPRPLVSLSGWPIFIALVLRVGLVILALKGQPGRDPRRLFWTSDTSRYLDLAVSLLRGEFSTAAGTETYRLPGYPLFLSPGVALGWPTAYALAAQALLCCLLIVMVVRTARLIGLGDRAAIAAGVLCAVEPNLLLWSLQLMPDVPLAAVVAATLLALVVHLRDGSAKALALAVALAAGSALVKPVAYGLGLVVAFIAAGVRREEGARSALRPVLAALLGGALILGAWHVRNWTVGGFSGFSTQFSHVIRSADFEAWLANNPRAKGEAIRNEWGRLGLESPTAIPPPIRVDRPLPVRLRLYLRGVWRTLSNPGVLAWLQFLDLEPQGMAASQRLSGTGPWSFFVQSIKERPRVVTGSVILGALNLVYWSLFALGLRGMMRRSRAVAWAAGLFISYFALISGGPWGQSRFRVPFVSALCVIAAVAVDRGADRKAAAEPETAG